MRFSRIYRSRWGKMQKEKTAKNRRFNAYTVI